MDTLKRLWNLEGMFHPVDIDLGFYLIKFEIKSDYNKVYTGGPQIIQDHYLTVRKWHVEFKADMVTAINTAVWLRFPLLPIEFYDEESILKIAKKLGKPLRVDNKTKESLRASYARVCVEIDLSQPLNPSVAIAIGKYEHVHLICFPCGRVAHRKEICNMILAPEKMDESTFPTDAITDQPDKKPVTHNGTVREDGPEEIGFGEWMLVQPKNRRQPKEMAQRFLKTRDLIEEAHFQWKI